MHVFPENIRTSFLCSLETMRESWCQELKSCFSKECMYEESKLRFPEGEEVQMKKPVGRVHGFF